MKTIKSDADPATDLLQFAFMLVIFPDVAVRFVPAPDVP
jgi:hypothetical protein